jgi:endonuclease/exonuclease/phosphatase family metal-dependent hydrolase
MKILTHNVYWFQGYPSRWGEERVAEDTDVLEALIQLYASAEVDVLCLQEVHRSDLAERIAQELGMATCLHAPGGFRSDYGGVVMSRNKAQCRDCTQVDGRPPHERVHVRLSLEQDGVPLELAMVHLPSNRFVDSESAGDSDRIDELKNVLIEYPRPDLIVGDMNCQPASSPYQFMVDSGYVDAVMIAGGVRAHGPRLDYIWLDGKHAARLIALTILDDDTFRRTPMQGEPWQLSDHIPLLMELQS